MQKSKCPKCENDSFELVQTKLKNSYQDYNIVQCDKCGCVITVLEHYNIGDLLQILASKLKIDINSK